MKSQSVTIQTKAFEWYFPVVLFITCILYKMVVTFKSVNGIANNHPPIESYQARCCHGTNLW